jgi:hypothetical protein
LRITVTPVSVVAAEAGIAVAPTVLMMPADSTTGRQDLVTRRNMTIPGS